MGGEVNGALNKLKKTREMFWSGRPDLNRGPPAPKSGALPKFRSPLHGNSRDAASGKSRPQDYEKRDSTNSRGSMDDHRSVRFGCCSLSVALSIGRCTYVPIRATPR